MIVPTDSETVTNSPQANQSAYKMLHGSYAASESTPRVLLKSGFYVDHTIRWSTKIILLAVKINLSI